MNPLSFVSRAGHLFALVLAPGALVPEPAPGFDAFGIALGLLALMGLPVLMVMLARTFRSRESRVSAVVAVLSAAMLAYAVGGDSAAPLLSQYYLAGPLIWGALAGLTATLAGEYLGVSFKNKRMGGAIIVLAIGIFTFRSQSALIASPRDQWFAVLAARPDDEQALHAVEPDLGSDPGRRQHLLAACIERRPDTCICRRLRADDLLLARKASEALAELGLSSCKPEMFGVQATLAIALGMAGELETAAAFVEPAAAAPGHEPRLDYALALLRDRQGRLDEAMALTRPLSQSLKQKAFAHEAKLLLASLLIKKQDLAEGRVVLLELLEARPDDPDAVYDLALIDDREGKYNTAREGYLRTLRLRPTARDARYNLALLTLKQGVVAEARNHAKKFREQFPEDPRVPELSALVELAH